MDYFPSAVQKGTFTRLSLVMVEGCGQLEHNTFCLQDVAEAFSLERLTAPRAQLVSRHRPTGAFFSGTVDELVDVHVAFVVPSESCVTYVSNPRLVTIHEKVFSICTEMIKISMQYLPYGKVTFTSSAGPMTALSCRSLIFFELEV